jgi:ketosteroid isomerase-like protein
MPAAWRHRTMKKLLVACALAAAVTAALPALVSSQTSKTTDAAAVAAITKLENDFVKANLASDSSFIESFFASDYTGGSSFGTWSTKASDIAEMKDPKKTKWNSASLSDLKVRVHGDLAVDTYRLTYDATLQGQHYARTVMCTHTLQQQNGSWKLMAEHCSQAAK